MASYESPLKGHSKNVTLASAVRYTYPRIEGPTRLPTITCIRAMVAKPKAKERQRRSRHHRNAKKVTTTVATMGARQNVSSTIILRLTSQISGPAPLILDCQPERHRRVRCIWFVRPFSHLNAV